MDVLTAKVLEALRRESAYVSGQRISQALGVSRMAISKHIRKLRDLGYEIESVPNRGHRLLKVPDVPLMEEIAPHLRTRAIGRPCRFLPACDSTNVRLAELAAAGAVEGTVVVADRQSGGRGRMGRDWFSPPGGNLYFSVLLRPAVAPGIVPRLALVAGLSIVEALNAGVAGLGAALKWPNDVLVADRKLAGVLCEMEAEADLVHHVIVGVGLNVNLPADHLPAELRDVATSLLIETGEAHARAPMLASLLNRLEHNYRDWLDNGLDALLPRMRDVSMLTGRHVSVALRGEPMAGVVEGLDADGCLLIRDTDGTVRHIPSGEVHVERHD